MATLYHIYPVDNTSFEWSLSSIRHEFVDQYGLTRHWMIDCRYKLLLNEHSNFLTSVRTFALSHTHDPTNRMQGTVQQIFFIIWYLQNVLTKLTH